MQQTVQLNKENPMRRIKVDKVTLNMGTGTPGDPLEKALKLLKKVSQGKPVSTVTHKRIPTWGVRPGLEIGAKVTIRGKKAEELLEKLFDAVERKLPASKFDDTGNFSFGITEYLNIPGVEYDSTIGIIGLEAAVTLIRPGFRIKFRARNKKRINKRHSISKEEAIKFIQEKFKVKVK